MDLSNPVAEATTPRPAHRLRRLAVALVIVALVLAGWAALASWQIVTPTFVSYWVVDQHILGVQTVCGPPPNDSSDIAKVVETATQVQIAAECRRPGLILGETAVGYLYTFTVRLAAPLAARDVVDGNGMPATLCPAVRCGAP